MSPQGTKSPSLTAELGQVGKEVSGSTTHGKYRANSYCLVKQKLRSQVYPSDYLAENMVELVRLFKAAVLLVRLTLITANGACPQTAGGGCAEAAPGLSMQAERTK